MNSKSRTQPLQDVFLNLLRKERVPVSIYLTNGVKLQGHVESFDQYVVFLRSGTQVQMIYKHTISTVSPSRQVSLPLLHGPIPQDMQPDEDKPQDQEA